MQPARFLLTSGCHPLQEAQAIADILENNISIEALAVSIAETDEAQSLWSVFGYFETRNLAETARRIFGLPTDSISALPETDWVRESLLGLAPVFAGRFFLYGSHDRHRRRCGGINLELDAQTAFGTGHHGTTAGCLAAFDRILKSNRPRKVLDLGCGTGVLALAAAKLHTELVIASDIDAAAVTTAKANAMHNGIIQGLKVVHAVGLQHNTIRNNAPYDLIFANILAGPLAKLACELAHILAPGGYLILSGLTADQLRWIKACYVNQGLSISSTGVRHNWATLVMHKVQ